MDTKGLTGVPSREEMALIGAYTRRALSPEEVYTFPVVLCDNEVDREGERFSIPALEGLAQLFVGKTGIFDHDPKGSNQTARIYRCRVEKDDSRLTAAGEPYCSLRADAYMLRCDATKDLILEIDGGIKKEVSVGCAMGSAVCSVCGADRRKNPCRHQPGERYEGKLCHIVLGDPADAYEWSFVAIPAQPRAGVVKGLGSAPLPVLEKAMGRGEGLTLTPGETAQLARWAGELDQAAKQGLLWREKALAEAVRLGRLCCPGLSRELLEKTLRTLGAEELEEWTAEYRRQTARRIPLPQTAPAKAEKGGNDQNDPFKV